MREGVAVVAYFCDGIRLLKDCHIDGQYGFMGMTRREQVVRLENADELRESAAQRRIPGRRGAARVDHRQSRWSWSARPVRPGGHPTKDDLKGTCDGATHYVRGALVGAFVVDRGSQAKVRAAAEILGVGAGANSSSAAQYRNQDGDPADCKNASPDSPKAPAPTDAPAVAAVDEPCPQGLVFSDGKCTAPAAAAAYQCTQGNADECTPIATRGTREAVPRLEPCSPRGKGSPATLPRPLRC
jgi:hypothetical protein